MNGTATMGLFLSMSGVVGVKADQVAEALKWYASGRSGSMEQEHLTSDDEGCLVLSEGMAGATVLYPTDFLAWADVSRYLSLEIGKPVFSFRIHDSDMWMYMLYEYGEIQDLFIPIPNYFGELDEVDGKGRRGNAVRIARKVPGLTADKIANYLVPWNDELLQAADMKRAYPSDEHAYGSEWQLLDFMAKLGFDFPLDDRGEPRGTTYRFNCESSDT